MRLSICFFVLAASIFTTSIQARPLNTNGENAAPRMKVMSFNVQNLFDTLDNPKTQDEDFTPRGTQEWTESIIQDKIRNLSAIIRDVNPDVIGVVEIENQQMLMRLVTEGLAGMGYQAALAGPSDDFRGIRNGIISRYPIVDKKTHRVWKDTWKTPGSKNVSKTRDILEVTVDTGVNKGNGRFVTYLVNHWPSRAGGPIRNQWRLEVAQQLTQIVKNITTKDTSRRVIALGDFNDDIFDDSFRKGTYLVQTEDALAKFAPGTMFAADFELAKLPAHLRGTFYFDRGKVWNALDHVLIAGGTALNTKQIPGFRYVPGSLQINRHPFVNKMGQPLGCELFDRVHSGSRTRCPKGAADHLPLSATFEFR